MSAPTAAELASVPMFAALAQADLEAMAKRFTIRRYPKGAIVANTGDRLDLFSVILSGTILWFWRDDADHLLKRGTEGPGGHFADATLNGGPILMSVMALDDLRVASIPMSELRALLLRHPHLAVGLLMDVVARLRRLLEATRSFTMEDVYARVVKLLLQCAVETGGRRVAALTHDRPPVRGNRRGDPDPRDQRAAARARPRAGGQHPGRARASHRRRRREVGTRSEGVRIPRQRIAQRTGHRAGGYCAGAKIPRSKMSRPERSSAAA